MRLAAGSASSKKERRICYEHTQSQQNEAKRTMVDDSYFHRLRRWKMRHILPLVVVQAVITMTIVSSLATATAATVSIVSPRGIRTTMPKNEKNKDKNTGRFLEDILLPFFGSRFARLVRRGRRRQALIPEEQLPLQLSYHHDSDSDSDYFTAAAGRRSDTILPPLLRRRHRTSKVCQYCLPLALFGFRGGGFLSSRRQQQQQQYWQSFILKSDSNSDSGSGSNSDSALPFSTPTVQFELAFGGGGQNSDDVWYESVELTCADDAAREARRIVAAADAAAAEKNPRNEHNVNYPTADVLEQILRQHWDSAISRDDGFGLQPIPYRGPTHHHHAVAAAVADTDKNATSPISSSMMTSSILLEESGLVLDVGPSTLGDQDTAAAGEGLFVRKANAETKDILQTAGSAFCGYAQGCWQSQAPVNNSAIYEFRLDHGLESQVWYKNQLVTIEKALLQSGAVGVVGHVTHWSNNCTDNRSNNNDDNDNDNNDKNQRRRITDLVPDEMAYPDRTRYFVPHDEQPVPLTIQTIGHKANDLAVNIVAASGDDNDNHDIVVIGSGQGRDGTIINDDKDSNNDDAVVAQHREYDAHSDMQNLLIIVPRVKLRNRTGDDGTSSSSSSSSPSMLLLLEPNGAPIMTCARSVLITNYEHPMEVGCKYGFQYWKV